MSSRKSQPPHSAATGKSDTKSLLSRAALEEFCQYGFGGTDTNKIARRAGFAPQTFYRWFEDKTEVFVAAYRAWEDQELSVLESLADENGAAAKMAEAVIRHHRDHLLFRRSLRQLSVESPVVRQARAASRKRQVDRVLAWAGQPTGNANAVLIDIFQVERLADAVAEGELQDLGVAESQVRDAIADILQRMKSRPTSQ